MKPSIKTLLAIGLAYTITATPSFAQLFTFDENGNSSTNNPSGPVLGKGAIPFQVAPDPSGGIAANVLIYQLPFFVTPGDVALLEPGQSSQTPSDIVRFFNNTAGPGTEIIFYSDVEPGAPDGDLADTGLPVSPNAFPIPEVGPEGNNGAFYQPLAGAPGSLPSGGQIAYNIISDVPEPSLLALTALGGGLLLVTLKRRHQVRI